MLRAVSARKVCKKKFEKCSFFLMRAMSDATREVIRAVIRAEKTVPESIFDAQTAPFRARRSRFVETSCSCLTHERW